MQKEAAAAAVNKHHPAPRRGKEEGPACSGKANGEMKCLCTPKPLGGASSAKALINNCWTAWMTQLFPDSPWEWTGFGGSKSICVISSIITFCCICRSEVMEPLLISARSSTWFSPQNASNLTADTIPGLPAHLQTLRAALSWSP